MSLKLIRDSIEVARLHYFADRRDWISYFVFIFILPLSMLFFAQNLAPEGANIGPRLIAGAVVFSLGLSTVNSLAQSLVSERFNHQLQLFIVSPVHKLSYALGMIGYGTLRGFLAATAVITAAPLFGFSLSIGFTLLPIALLTSLSLTGVSLVIGTRCGSQSSGNLIANLAGVLVVMVSPIYYEASRLPMALRWLSQLSPYTHAADALEASLMGATAYGAIGLLAAITTTGLALGFTGMRWRDV